MEESCKFLISVLFTISIIGHGVCAEVDTYSFLMPDVRPNMDEQYLCTPIRIAPGKNFFVVGFKPNATMNTAHHMLLYGCSEPGAIDLAWNCGEMQSNTDDSKYNRSSPCKTGSQIVYAWARDAPRLQLPPGVGFLVGEDSPIKYMVLQVHYMKKFPEGKTDNSGVFLEYTTERMPRQAGVILLGTSGIIPAKKVEHMETACTINEDKVIHPFAFRPHTHGLGVQVTGFVVRRSPKGDMWELLGSKNPQLPQMFYPVVSRMPITTDDVLAARCVMNNTKSHAVSIGATNNDEMCNFYLMYWVQNDTPLEQKYCFTPGPPYYYWSRAPQNFDRIPDRDFDIV